MIEVDHLTKSYGQSRAVDDISFTVEKGEILGFLGPNGAGKTTTMRVLTGYLPATAGTARIAGYDVFEQSMEVRRRIGYLPETPPLYPEMSIEDYLSFVARIKGVSSADIAARVDQAMALTSLATRRSELIKRLSRGYKQRVGIAQAIVHNPDVVILDEPTVGLDPNQIKEVRKLIKGLAGEHTIILSTHILPEVEITCDRVVIINRGKIAAVDTPRNLVDQRQSGSQVRLSVRNSGDETSERLQQALHSIEGVQGVNVSLNEAGDLLTATVETAHGHDLRASIASRVVNDRYDLLELGTINVSLEDIFQQLTTEEKGEKPAAPSSLPEFVTAEKESA
ncbi:MAG: ATP-binding cassette domain-containing protein [Acidobacteria bacterium]|nr:ATP-binding cassette domain-containing protein [Acidobacteriota bacterium]